MRYHAGSCVSVAGRESDPEFVVDQGGAEVGFDVAEVDGEFLAVAEVAGD